MIREQVIAEGLLTQQQLATWNPSDEDLAAWLPAIRSEHWLTRLRARRRSPAPARSGRWLAGKALAYLAWSVGLTTLLMLVLSIW